MSMRPTEGENPCEMSLGLLTLGGLDTFAVQCCPRGDDDTDDIAELFPVSQGDWARASPLARPIRRGFSCPRAP